MAESETIHDPVKALREQVDLLTENMMRLQAALILTNQKIAQMQSGSILDIAGRGMRKN